MAFNMKYSGGTPFYFKGEDPTEVVDSSGGSNIDPKKLKYKTTKTTTDLGGNKIDTAGTATAIIPGDKPKTFAEVGVDPEEGRAYWAANPDKYEEYKNSLKDKEVTVTRERDYSNKKKTYPNPFKGRRQYKGIVLDELATQNDNLESETIANIFKAADDKDGFQAYLTEHGYKRTKEKDKKNQSEELGDYKYTVSE